MIDALLYAVRETVQQNDYGSFSYDYASVQIMPDGHPTPRAGNVFIAVHQKGETSDLANSLNVYYDFALTLTMRLQGYPIERIGEQMLATKLAEQTGFNRRANALAVLMHMNWNAISLANEKLQEMMPAVELISGYSEPARYSGMDFPQFCDAEWFYAEPSGEIEGLKAEINFRNCRRGPQAIGSFS